MPKKVDEWHQVCKPTTPSQINNFFDLCTKWLVGTPADSKQESLKYTNDHYISEKSQLPTFAISEEDVNCNYISSCHFCGANENIRLMTGNPFSRKDKVIVCNNCIPS